MSGDVEGRLLAAGDVLFVTEMDGENTRVNEYRLRPICAQHLCDLERDALLAYKRQYLEAYKEFGTPEEYRAKLDEAARWDLSNLPQKDAYDTRKVAITDALRAWVASTFNAVPETDAAIRAVVTTALDSGKLTPDKLAELAGPGLVRGRIRFDQWWVTSTMTGMITFILTSLRSEHPNISRERVQSWPFHKIAEAARMVESITAAKMGNT